MPLPNIPHPLEQLRAEEADRAREVVLHLYPGATIRFRSIFLEEPAKAALKIFLAAEHSHTLSSSTPRPPRLARVQFDRVRDRQHHEYTESVIDVAEKTEVNEPVEIAQAVPPREAEPLPAADNTIPAAPTELPRTASPIVEIGLVGFVFVVGAIAARKARLS